MVGRLAARPTRVSAIELLEKQRRERERKVGLGAVHILELAANSGLTLEEVGDPSEESLRLAKRARRAVMRAGCCSAVKLEAAAMLREGWLPGQKLAKIPSRVFTGSAGQSCAICARDVSGRLVCVDELGRGGAGVVVCSGWGCDLPSREGNHSFGHGS